MVPAEPPRHQRPGARRRFLGDGFTIEYPTGSGAERTLSEVAVDLRERLISLFRVGGDGRRPAYGFVDELQHDPRWNAHQTTWTGVVVDMIRRRPDRDALAPPAAVSTLAPVDG